EALPVVALPGFRNAHPRLPHPSAADLAQLAALNPGYVAARRNAAGGGKGPVDAVAFAALAAPDSQDLGLLHRRLMDMRFTDRGDDQVKALALAYDWLHAQWSYAERIALQDKLGEGCQYVIDFIRRERLSPYNAVLYNSPLQALMACSIALYREHPRGEALMAFTHDLWTRRVLPVWRQVFGTHGGWHEGGEYVAVGIGQAVYTLPAMWLAATGEDLFASETGLRGFLDFLVYRTRPDGTQIRWGDASNLQRHPPDAAPLALHYRHAAAYGLAAPPVAPTPTGWPWGPLSDATLTDTGAVAALPLSRHFDGIGLIVARSDWNPDATYVTFKAGDNFWSHSHLDQGAFTIDKGGPLAVDSGIYGPRYGSDHHMNYAYQTVAHNALTVTDPADDAPLPTPEGPRPIANDGGQRRVGSGWHVAPAPIDRGEWELERELYHTGRIARFLDEDALTVAVADLTPAYTNSHSAPGEASHRSRRVERAWRVFGYDRIDDVIVIYDDVRATDSAFRKRWLLHTIDAPQIGENSFIVTAPRRGAATTGGRLEAKVLLPQDGRLLPIGGHGLEFFVDGRNYDDEGKLVDAIRRPPLAPEAGGWRVELMPSRDAKDDQFLVVLLPTRADARPPHRVRLLRQGTQVGCEIAGPHRTTRWWFTPGGLGVRIEVGEQPSATIYQLQDEDDASPAGSPSWLQRLLGRLAPGR
ncbi:heparinase II/III domain-containing protein, partial [Aromatoleum petrolei]